MLLSAFPLYFKEPKAVHLNTLFLLRRVGCRMAAYPSSTILLIIFVS